MNPKIIQINSLDEISNTILRNNILYINIDRGCLIPEYLLARVYNNNPFIRNKIIQNTNINNFSYTNNLIPTRHNFSSFVKSIIGTIKELYYVTNTIINNNMVTTLNELDLPIAKIININDIDKNKKLIYIDSSIEYIDHFNDSSIIYKLNIFN